MQLNEDYLAHHGTAGQKWGIRNYQNPDGSLTPEGYEHYYGRARSEKSAEKAIAKDRKKAEKKDLKTVNKIAAKAKMTNKQQKEAMDAASAASKNALGRVDTKSKTFINAYNAKAAELMNKNAADLNLTTKGTGRAIEFVANRGTLGVTTAMSTARNTAASMYGRGVWNDGRKAYSKDYASTVSINSKGSSSAAQSFAKAYMKEHPGTSMSYSELQQWYKDKYLK